MKSHSAATSSISGKLTDEFERGVRFLELGIEDESQYCVLFGHDEANQRVLADSAEDRL